MRRLTETLSFTLLATPLENISGKIIVLTYSGYYVAASKHLRNQDAYAIDHNADKAGGRTVAVRPLRIHKRLNRWWNHTLCAPCRTGFRRRVSRRFSATLGTCHSGFIQPCRLSRAFRRHAVFGSACPRCNDAGIRHIPLSWLRQRRCFYPGPSIAAAEPSPTLSGSRLHPLVLGCICRSPRESLIGCTKSGNSLGPALMGAIDRSRASTSQRVHGTARRHTPPR